MEMEGMLAPRLANGSGIRWEVSTYIADTPSNGAFFAGSGRLVCLTLDT